MTDDRKRIEEIRTYLKEAHERNYCISNGDFASVFLLAQLDKRDEALRKIAVAEDCEGYGEVLGGKLMEMAREALGEE